MPSASRVLVLLVLLVLSLMPGAVRAQEEARTVPPEAVKEKQARPPRLYVSFGGLKDATGSLSAAQVRAAEALMRGELARLGAVAAPEKEGPEQARKVLRARGLTGYRLLAEVHAMPEGGLRLSMVCLSYPDQGLLGDVEVRASGAEPEELLAALAPRVIEEAADAFEWD